MKFRNLNRFIMHFDNKLNNTADIKYQNSIHFQATHYSYKLLINGAQLGISMRIHDSYLEMDYTINGNIIFNIYYQITASGQYIEITGGNLRDPKWEYSDMFSTNLNRYIYHYSSTVNRTPCSNQLFQPIKDYCCARWNSCPKCEKITHV